MLRGSISCVVSPQTLSEADRRLVAVWAADCAERVLGLFEAEAPGDRRPRDAIAGLRAFARGELRVRAALRLARPHAACLWGGCSGSGSRRPSRRTSRSHTPYGRSRLGCRRLCRQGGWSRRPGPAGRARPRNPLAARPSLPGCESRPASAPAGRRAFGWPARAGPPRQGPSRHDHRRSPGQPGRRHPSSRSSSQVSYGSARTPAKPLPWTRKMDAFEARAGPARPRCPPGRAAAPRHELLRSIRAFSGAAILDERRGPCPSRRPGRPSPSRSMTSSPRVIASA